MDNMFEKEREKKKKEKTSRRPRFTLLCIWLIRGQNAAVARGFVDPYHQTVKRDLWEQTRPITNDESRQDRWGSQVNCRNQANTSLPLGIYPRQYVLGTNILIMAATRMVKTACLLATLLYTSPVRHQCPKEEPPILHPSWYHEVCATRILITLWR